MDWTLAIKRNHTILLRVVAVMFDWLSLGEGAAPGTISRTTWRRILLVLRPSESACRRLVLVAMYVRGVVAPAYQGRSARRKERAEADVVEAERLCQRLRALKAALDDLDGQALRMARLYDRMRRWQPKIGKFPPRPMRPGRPPGARRRHQHEVDEVLEDCHQLALMAPREYPPPFLPDTG